MLTPLIDKRTYDDLWMDEKHLASIYTPEWNPEAKDCPGAALLKIFIHMQQEVIGRLNRVPEKNFAAFLEMLAIRLLPALPARVPATFSPAKGTQESIFVPKGTRVAAAETEKHGALLFETEAGFSAINTSILAIYSVVPEKDAIYCHFDAFQKGGQSIVEEELWIFSDNKKNLQKHVMYIGHDTLFKLEKPANITLELVLKQAESQSLDDIKNWIWDGVQVDGIVKGSSENAYSIALSTIDAIEKRSISNIESFWLSCQLTSAEDARVPQVELIKIKSISNIQSIQPDLGFYNFNPLDMGKEFFPFGPQPRLFDTFYMSSREAFSKMGAMVTVNFESAKRDVIGNGVMISWEFWNGRLWKQLTTLEEKGNPFDDDTFTGNLKFVCKEAIQETEINGEKNYWIRGRLISGNYGKDEFKQKVNLIDGKIKGGTIVHGNVKEANLIDGVTAGGHISNATIEGGVITDGTVTGAKIIEGRREDGNWVIEPNFSPPCVSAKITYEFSSSADAKEKLHCITWNNLEHVNQREAIDSGKGFKPFIPLAETNPAIYIGLTHPLGKGNMSIFFKVAETKKDFSYYPKLNWCYDPETKLDVADNTDYLSKTGTLEILGSPKHSNLLKFGKDCYWLMAECVQGSLEGLKMPVIKEIYINTVWAEQVDTVTEEILGSGNGEMNGVFSFIKRPVVSSDLWVREGLALTKADKADFLSKGLKIDEVKDQEGKVVDNWVMWKAVDDLIVSGPLDRHYLLDGAAGEAIFGDGRNGMIPPIANDNIKATYRSGGGVKGNVNQGEITGLMSPIPGIDRVSNNIAAEGGSDTESLEGVLDRGPERIRHRDRAVTEEDFERLARAASSFVARSKCVVKGGRLRIMIIPNGDEDRPVPSQGLRRIVDIYLKERCLNTLSSSDFEVCGEDSYIKKNEDDDASKIYREISVTADIIPKSIEMAVPLEKTIVQSLRDFFHPLRGGPDGTGWSFGRGVHLSDVYARIEGMSDVDHVENLLLNGAANDVSIKDYQTVCSGKHSLTMQLEGGE